MIVDTSALVAIFADEPEREALIRKLASAHECLISAGTLTEFGTVLVRRFDTPDPRRILSDFVATFGLRVEPVTLTQTMLAIEGYTIFGRGARHPARLNFGDCFAYALAKQTAKPLLFKGTDFIQTDIRSAI